MKKLWIIGDSYGTFDVSDGTHWAKNFAEYMNCDIIHNLSRGGFDTKAIVYTGAEILDNCLWPGRVWPSPEEDFNHKHDILLVFTTTPERFCHLSEPSKKFDPQLSIANLNWWMPSLVWLDKHGNRIGCQEPMPWIEHMPMDSNLYSQNFGILRDPNLSATIENTHLENELLYFDHMWEQEVQSNAYNGLKLMFDRLSQGSQIFFCGMRQSRGIEWEKNCPFEYFPHHSDYVKQGLIDFVDPEHKDRLCNHLLPIEHEQYRNALRDKHLSDYK